MKTYRHFWLYRPHFLLEWEVFQTAVVGNLKKNLISKILLRKSCRLWINWKNIVEPVRPQMTIWRLRIACWIIKTADTCSEYVIFIAFPLQQWLHDRSSMLRFKYIACLVSKWPQIQQSRWQCSVDARQTQDTVCEWVWKNNCQVWFGLIIQKKWK